MRKKWIFIVICTSSLCAMDDALKAQEKLAHAMAEYVLSEEGSENNSKLQDAPSDEFCAECEDIAANGFAARCVQHISNPVGSDNFLNESK